MTATLGKVLVTDDDSSLRRALHNTLHSFGFDVREARDGEHAINEIRRDPSDAVLLDINMPGMGGIAACRELRKLFPVLQILMLSVRDREEEKVRALEAGADDYVVKPFSVPELVARLKSAVRRSTGVLPQTAKAIVIGEIKLNPDCRTVLKDNRPLRLTPKEFDLLHYLMAHAGIPIAHKKLLNAVWGSEYGQELEYLRTFMYQLRKKVEDDPASPQYLFTEAWLGYRFRASDTSRLER
jgi:two-component system, OmpR family, KDP operon response regulator KdpE